MASVKVTVYGRVKPCPRNSQSREFQIKTGDNEEYITFSGSKTLPTKKTYRFRKIFNEQTTQEEIFDTVARPVIDRVFSGYNGTIFTYGQTGSGKTFTMTGDIDKWLMPGLIPRTIQTIFQQKEKDCTVAITYCEIYNEHVYDLIRSERVSDSEHLGIVEDSSGPTNFRNLSVHVVDSAYEAIQLLVRGDSNKMIAETTSNIKSSRSHVLFSITLELPHPNQENFFIKPVLYLVDLAGSEKLSKCKQMGNPWETRYINLSLHYLEQVLLALRQPGRVHIPYRNSLMTALLRNSLGGNCITSMIATFSLSTSDLEETLQTCRFAERIAMIKNEVKISDVFNPERIIEDLRRENKRLKSQIKLLGGQLCEDLDDQEKERCSELVQHFIENNKYDTLPFADIKRMEYCVCLLRDEILTKTKTPQQQQSDATVDFFQNCCDKMSGTELNVRKFSSQTLPPKRSEKNLKKKNSMNIPKINITYKRWKSTEQLLESELKDSGDCLTRKKLLNGEVSQMAPRKSKEKFGTNCSEEETFNEDSLHPAKKFMATKRYPKRENPEEGNEIKTVFKTKKADLYISATTNGCQSNVENKPSSLQVSFGRFKDVINSEIDLENEVEIECEEEINLNHFDDEEVALQPFDDLNHFSCTLTGDLEVDEEILKFYKARYSMFKNNKK